MILEQTTDIAGNIRIIWQQPSGITYHFKFKEEPSLQKLEDLGNERETLEERSSVEPLFKQVNNKLIITLIELIKDRPSITTTQFNAYLGTLPWYDEARIRALIYEIGTTLADRKEVTLASMSESQFLQKVRDFIVNTPNRKLAKLFLNQSDI